ncbi:MAG TPA: 6-phosphogluconolactonase [Spirochaetota bacterium]|mgnify:CR=1 FL=1|nr:6-phosphogluconolactonase [Spirochaetota bacterium]
MDDERRVFASADDLAISVAALIGERLAGAGARDVHLAISGGKTPGIIFECLADQLPVVLSCRLHVWWVDERLVPPDDPESNYGLFARTFLVRHPLPAGQVHRIHGELDPDRALAGLREELRILAEEECRDAWGCQPVFDLVLLGVGADGHTASVFPGDEAAFEADESCLAVCHPASGQGRITLSPKTIMAAREVVYCLTGTDKTGIAARILDRGAPQDLPAGRIRSRTGVTRWYLDRDAARLLSAP